MLVPDQPEHMSVITFSRGMRPEPSNIVRMTIQLPMPEVLDAALRVEANKNVCRAQTMQTERTVKEVVVGRHQPHNRTRPGRSSVSRHMKEVSKIVVIKKIGTEMIKTMAEVC